MDNTVDNNGFTKNVPSVCASRRSPRHTNKCPTLKVQLACTYVQYVPNNNLSIGVYRLVRRLSLVRHTHLGGYWMMRHISRHGRWIYIYWIGLDWIGVLGWVVVFNAKN